MTYVVSSEISPNDTRVIEAETAQLAAQADTDSFAAANILSDFGLAVGDTVDVHVEWTDEDGDAQNESCATIVRVQEGAPKVYGAASLRRTIAS